MKNARSALVPPTISLKDWIDARMGGELEVFTESDPSGNCGKVMLKRLRDLTDEELDSEIMQETLKSLGQSKEDRKSNGEQFYKSKKGEFLATLPADSFTVEEERLRIAIHEFLSSWKGPLSPTLTHAGSDPSINQARRDLMPSIRISLKDWCEERIGEEIEMAPIGDEQWGIDFRGQLRSNVSLPSFSRKRKGV